MMEFKKNVWLGIGLALILLPWQTPGWAQERATEEVVVAAVPRHFPPHYELHDGQPAGFAVDIMEAVARRAGLRLEYRVYDNWHEVQEAVRQGEAQLIPNMGISADRAQLLDFSVPVETTQLVRFARRGQFNNTEPLNAAHTIGVVENNLGRQLTATSPAAQRVYASIAEALLALLSSQVDVVAYPENAGWRIAREAGIAAQLAVLEPPLRNIQRAIAVRQGNPALVRRINQALSPLLASDEYQTIYRRWYGAPPPFWDTTKVLWLLGLIILLLGACFGAYRYQLLRRLNRQLTQGLDQRDAALQRLTETHHRLNLALDGSEAGAWDMHLSEHDGRLEVREFHASGRLIAVLGLQTDTLTYPGWRRRIVLADRVKIDQALAASRADKDHRYEVEYRVHHGDGSIRWLHSRGMMHCDEAGRARRCTGFDWDITSQKHHEEQIQESQRALEMLIGNIPGITYRCQFNRKWTMEYVSDYCLTLTGYKPDELILNHHVAYGELIHPDDRDRVWQEVQQAVVQGQRFRLEYRIISKDGTPKWVLEQGSAVYGPERSIALEGVIFDIGERKQREHWARWETECDEELLRLGQRLLQPIELNELTRLVLNLAKKLTGSPHGFVGYIHPVSQTLVCPALDDGRKEAGTPDQTRVFPATGGMCGWVIEHNEALLSNDLKRDPRLQAPPDQHLVVSRFLAAPAQKGDRPIGQVAVANAREDYNAHHLRFIQRLAELYAIALHQQQQQREHEQTHRTLRTLSTCNTTLIRARSEDELLESLCQAMAHQEDLALAWIGYGKSGCGDLQSKAAAGPDQHFVEDILRPCQDTGADHCPAGESLAQDRTLVCNDLNAEDCHIHWRREAVRHGLLANLSVPIRVNGEAIGSLNIFAKQRGFFSRDKIRLFEELAADIGYGIRSLRTEQQKQAYWQGQEQIKLKLQDVLQDTIEAITRAVEKRDPYTAGHQRRVAELAAAIGALMGMDESRLEGLRLGALIHDVGKIYIPAEILNRPGRLSEHEFGLIKTHTEVGYDIIKDVDFPWPVAQMVVQHHERMDGSGYPRGLVGEQIILEARILAVADVVEAITAHRPYRPALGIEEGLREITAHRGQRYDPEVVDACVALIRRDGFRWNDPPLQAPTKLGTQG